MRFEEVERTGQLCHLKVNRSECLEIGVSGVGLYCPNNETENESLAQQDERSLRGNTSSSLGSEVPVIFTKE